jgi:hypothetical protein
MRASTAEVVEKKDTDLPHAQDHHLFLEGK